ncbi:MAG: excalibur calcium-binding domain-containing protein [Propionibacteriaceae bacterium]|nr:excalibur calcium-binding domain-containing protein [Propionibacteriaceae bacterium]
MVAGAAGLIGISLGLAGCDSTGSKAVPTATETVVVTPEPVQETVHATVTATATEVATQVVTETAVATETVTAEETRPPSRQVAAPASTAEESVYYANCREAKAAGAAPLHRGDPGYRSDLDRDGDGVACER